MVEPFATRPGARGMLCLLIGGLLTQAACTPAGSLWLDLPELPAGTRALVLTLTSDVRPEDGGDPSQMFAETPESLGAASIRLRYSTEARVRVRVLAYTHTLEELQLAPGPVPHLLPDDRSRQLPAPDAAFMRQVVAGDEEPWAASSPADEVAALRLPAMDWPLCQAKGGCWVPSAERPDDELCSIPCPPPSELRAPEPPATPADPELPALGPCPLGWATLPATGDVPVATCAPALAAMECPFGQLQLPNAPACEPIAACADGGLPHDLPTGRAVTHVSPASVVGRGIGTFDAPFASIAEALATSAGSVIVLAPGTYRESFELPAGTMLAGACPELVVLEPGGPIVVRGPGAALRGLRLSGAGEIVRVEGGALDLHGVLVDGTSPDARISITAGSTVSAERVAVLRAGLSALGGHLTLADVVIDGAPRTGLEARGEGTRVGATNLAVRSAASGDAPLAGISAAGGATLELEASSIDMDAGAGVVADGVGTRVIARDLAVRAARESGLVVTSSAAVEGTRLQLSGTATVGISIAGGRAVLTELVVVGDGAVDAQGVVLSGHASAAITRAVLARWSDGALHLLERSTGDVTSLVVSSGGPGVRVEKISSLRLHRARIARAHGPGISISDDGTAATLSDVALVSATPEAIAGPAGALRVVAQARLEGERVVIDGGRGAGLAVLGRATSARLSDLAIRAVERRSEINGFGVFVEEGAVVLTRASVEDCEGPGLYTSDGATSALVAADLLVARSGPGLVVQGLSSSAELHGAAFRGSTGAGVQLAANTALLATDLEISGTASAGGLSVGLGAAAESDVGVTRLRISGGDLGVLAGDRPQGATRGRLSLTDGELRGNGTGASVPAVQDLERAVLDRLRYVDNGTDLVVR